MHYNLHILLRFDLERDLVAGRLKTADLEEAWNARFLADFGVPVDKPSNGLLQDVHWSVGLFGYFPTYTLGNVYAGCLYEALAADIPDLAENLSNGDATAATGWLRDRVQRHGGLYEPREVIRRATGAEPGVGPLLDYLDAKFSATLPDLNPRAQVGWISQRVARSSSPARMRSRSAASSASASRVK